MTVVEISLPMFTQEFGIFWHESYDNHSTEINMVRHFPELVDELHSCLTNSKNPRNLQMFHSASNQAIQQHRHPTTKAIKQLQNHPTNLKHSERKKHKELSAQPLTPQMMLPPRPKKHVRMRPRRGWIGSRLEPKASGDPGRSCSKDGKGKKGAMMMCFCVIFRSTFFLVVLYQYFFVVYLPKNAWLFTWF